MPNSLLEIQHLSTNLAENKAIDGINFKISSGQIIGIAEPNRSGKNILFDIICNSPYSSYNGEVYFEGKNIRHLCVNKIAALGIARTSQGKNIYLSLSAISNVLISIESQPNLLNLEDREAVAENALQMVGFPTELYSTSFSALSIFNQRQLELAIAIALSPKLLLMDAPTANLPPSEAQHIVDIIFKIRNNGIAILIAEHSLEVIFGISDQILILNKGRLAAYGSPKDVTNATKILDAYLEAVN